MIMLFTETGEKSVDFEAQLPDILGDNYYNDPETKQQPTKMFDDITDEKTFINNYANAQRTISKGETAFEERTKGMVKVPTAESSEDEVKAYREAHGVPETVDGYKLAIPEGIDKDSYTGIAATIKAEALAAGAPPTLVSKIWDKVVVTMGEQFKALEDKGAELMKVDEDAMKAEHKENYPAFIKGTDETLAKFKAGGKVKETLDSYGLGNHPAIRNLLAEIMPLVKSGKTVVGGGVEASDKDSGFPTYEYDEQGKPI